MLLNYKHIFIISLLGVLLAGCSGGDISISPATTDNSQDNSTTTTNIEQEAEEVVNPCASYTKDGNTFQGQYDGVDCDYSAVFVDSGNPLTVDLLINDLANDGVHNFAGSLVVGQSATIAELTAAGITKGGDGPKLSI